MRLLTVSLLALLLTGCLGEGDSPEACAYSVRQDLDASRFGLALERLQSRACETGLSPEEREINRAAAYIGEAGYDIADIFHIVLSDEPAGPESARSMLSRPELRQLKRLSGLGLHGALRLLHRADAAYARMMTAFPGGIDEACRKRNLTLLSPLQQDACFFSGLLAYARLARSFELLLQDQLDAFFGLQPLGCENDRNHSGVPDDSEIAACSLFARDHLHEPGGQCRRPGTRDGQPTGAVHWHRVPGIPELGFFEGGVRFATLVPIAVTVEPGGTCPTPRQDIRLLQPIPGGRASLAITDGLCETEITVSCPALDAAGGCWSCPIPRTDGNGAVTVSDSLLRPLNQDAERWIPVLSVPDGARAATELEDLRQRLCEPASGGPAACEREDGRTRVSADALREALRR